MPKNVENIQIFFRDILELNENIFRLLNFKYKYY